MKLDHLVILVSDLDKSLPWYAAVLGALGFEKTRDHVWLNADGQAVDLKQAEDLSRPYGRFAPGLNHTGFLAPSTAALETVRQTVAAAGFDVPEVQDFGDDRAVFLLDPDGMRIEVAARAWS